LVVGVLSAATAVAQGTIELCGCATDASLRPFNAGDPRTYPPGTSGCVAACEAGAIALPLPPDGTLRFSSFAATGAFTISFISNPSNTPATILVAGDVTLRAPRCCGTVTVAGNPGTPGTVQAVGTGGAGGPGGWRGGRGHGRPLGVGGLTPGGNREGPGGGWGATTNVEAIGGTFTGTPTFEPLIGGSGGGGGSGNQQAAACIGGGGGGGGGALLIKANGRVTLDNFTIVADGGPGGDPADRACAQGGAGGSGGAVRLVARTFAVTGMARISARAGSPAYRAGDGTAGRIRLEALDDSVRKGLTTEPIAIRTRANS
jgi:hypothetical protein